MEIAEEDAEHAARPAITAYLRRIGAKPRTFRKATVVEKIDSYERVVAEITFADDGSVEALEGYEPNEREQDAIKTDVAKSPFPRSIPAASINLLAEQLGQEATSASFFKFLDKSGKDIIFVRQRLLNKKGDKVCLPWTFWSDGMWRKMEPDGGVPLFGLDELRKFFRIMIHEGEKAARFCQEMRDGKTDEAREAFHALPLSWQQAIKNAGHLGWCTGAPNPLRTDWSPLQRGADQELILVTDNDQMGEDAAPRISQALRQPLTVVRFGKDFPRSFDLADRFPEGLWQVKGRRKYVGPEYEDCLWPGTWATVACGKGFRLRGEFVAEWWLSIRPQVFINKANPRRRYSKEEFNCVVAPYSDVDNPARLLGKQQSVQAETLAYEPGRPSGLIAIDKTLVINGWVPSDIKPKQADAAPFLAFMEHLIPDEKDRHKTLRWIATLIAKPDVHVLYALLLVSEMQGVGKTTLGEKILAPLVGLHNVSFPTERQVTDSAFNSWSVNKRLAIINEIYVGQSKKAYDNAKSYITDGRLTVEEKYQRPYEVTNWVHLYACSNSMRALRLASEDRRWFIPRVTEEKQPLPYWIDFNQWLSDDGLATIAAWAQDFVEKHAHIRTGAHAPWSTAKQEMIEEGMSPGELLVAATLDRLQEEANGQPCIILDTALVQLIKDRNYDGRHSDKLERPATVRKVAKARGWFINPTRVKVKAWKVWGGGPKLICSSAELAQKSPGELAAEGFEPFDLKWLQRM